MRAVILAAGEGRRLLPFTRDLPKPLLEIGGTSLLERQIDSLHRYGIDDVVVVTGYRADLIECRLGPRCRYVFNPFYDMTNSLVSLWLARRELDTDFLYLHGDVLFDPAILERLIATHREVCLVVERKSCVPEDMKVKVGGERILQINKTIAAAEAYGEFIGLARFGGEGRGALAEALEQIVRERGFTLWFESAVERLAQQGVPVYKMDTNGKPWIEIDFTEDLERARRDICPRIEGGLKEAAAPQPSGHPAIPGNRARLTVAAIRSRQPAEHGYEAELVWNRVLRWASYYVAWLFLKAGVSANTATYLSGAIGIAGCFLLALGGYPVAVAGALLVNLWTLLDNVDGTVARYNGSSSLYGKFIDTLTGSIVMSILFLSLGVGLYLHSDGYLDQLFRFLLGREMDRSLFLFLGAWTSLATIFPLHMGYDYERVFGVDVIELTTRIMKRRSLGGTLSRIGHSFLYHNLMPVLVLAVLLKALGLFLLFATITHTSAALYFSWQLLRRARRDSSG